MDSHQYLYYDSCHSEHIKRSIRLSQIIPLKRISSQKSDPRSPVKELKTGLAKGVIQRKELGSKFIGENVKEKDGQHIKGNRVPLVVTYNPNFKNLGSLISNNLQF